VSYRHINTEDRIVVAALLEEERSYSYIARRIGVHKSTISREIKRNARKPKPQRNNKPKKPEILTLDGRKSRGSGLTKLKYEAIDEYRNKLYIFKSNNKYYYSSVANKKAKLRRKLSNQQRTLVVQNSHSSLENYILDKLSGDQWSPEQIAHRLYKEYSLKISFHSIYRYIYNSSDKRSLVKHLRRSGTKYRRRHGTIARLKNHRKNIPSIHDRDPVIKLRTRLGDLEGDTIVGIDRKDRLLTHVDRATGECYIDLILNFNAQKIAQQTIEMVSTSEASTNTITYDRGVEFAEYEVIQKKTHTKVYFADAYSSYQRGTNENLNGLIRQYFPKRYDFKNISKKQLYEVQEKLNNRPRKRYDYRTPLEQREFLFNLSIVALRERI
jgi:IS30 family transposase